MEKIMKIFLVLLLFLLFNASAYSKNSAPLDSAMKELTGELESKKGKTLTVSITSQSALPEVGTSGTLSKYFEEEILGMNTHGYISLAEVEVKSVSENEIVFTVTKELTSIKTNGKKENLFKKGIIVKYYW